MEQSQNLKQVFANRLGQCFKRSGLLKITLGKKLGLTPSGIGQVLSGANFPSVDKIVLLADIFDVSIDWLTGRTNEVSSLSNSPEGILPYWISLSRGEPGIHGSFRYVYGVFPDENRKFLYLDEQPGGVFIKRIIDSRSQSYFLSLTSLLNWELKFSYNPFDRGNIDILFVHKDENDNIETISDGSRFNGLRIEKYSGAHVYGISHAYHNFVDHYLEKTTAEKIVFLRKIRMGETEADAE